MANIINNTPKPTVLVEPDKNLASNTTIYIDESTVIVPNTDHTTIIPPEED